MPRRDAAQFAPSRMVSGAILASSPTSAVTRIFSTQVFSRIRRRMMTTRPRTSRVSSIRRQSRSGPPKWMIATTGSEVIAEDTIPGLERRIVLRPRVEVAADVVAQRDALRAELPNPAAVAVEVAVGVVVVVAQDLPALAVAAVLLRAVEVVDRVAVDDADVLARGARGAVLPDLDRVGVARAATRELRDVRVRVGLADEAEGHVPVPAPEDAGVEQAADGVVSLAAEGPGAAGRADSLTPVLRAVAARRREHADPLVRKLAGDVAVREALQDPHRAVVRREVRVRRVHLDRKSTLLNSS